MEQVQDVPEAAPPEVDPARPRELDLDANQFVEVAEPYKLKQFICPSCEQPIPTRAQVHLAKPAPFAHLLNDVMRCPMCQFIFSYKTSTIRLIRA